MAGDPPAALRAEWSAWMRADPAHATAYERLMSLETEAHGLREAPALLALRHDTLARVSLARSARRLRPRPLLTLALAAAALVATVGPALMLDRAPWATQAVREQTYATAVGQRMNLTLQDGSQLTLNTASRVRVAYSGSERLIRLDAGQAWFDVAHDAERPFRVRAGDRIVTAHGTRFDVRLDDGALRVLLAEGSVSVADASAASAATARLRPNDLLIADARGVRVRRVADVSRFESWRDGVIIFDDAPLSEVVAEINRYATRPLSLADEKVARVRISGVYQVGGEAAFAEAVARGFPVRMNDRDPARLVLSAAP